jgi:ATP-dependent RNA helicase RhlE
MVAEDYLHRIGRTGRAGVDGDAVSLVCVDEAPLLAQIERMLGRPIDTQIVAGFEPDRSIRPEPIRLRSAGFRPEGRSQPGRRPAGQDSRHGRPSAPPRAWQAPRPQSGQRPHAAAGGSVVAMPGERFSR